MNGIHVQPTRVRREVKSAKGAEAPKLGEQVLCSIFAAGERVVARYRDLGAAMFSTADDGAVILDTDGTSVQIRGWLSGRTWRFRSCRAQAFRTYRQPPSRRG